MTDASVLLEKIAMWSNVEERYKPQLINICGFYKETAPLHIAETVSILSILLYFSVVICFEHSFGQNQTFSRRAHEDQVLSGVSCVTSDHAYSYDRPSALFN